MNRNEGDIEGREIEMLLPWYVTGTLDRAGKALVDSYLAQHPHMSAQLDLIRAEREQTVLVNEALGSPPPTALDRLIASLPAAQPSPLQRVTGALFQRIADFFTAPTGRAVRWATLVAAAIVIGQAAIITSLVMRDDSNTYQAASGHQSGDGIPALIAFTDDASAPAIARLLAEFDASIVDGPKPGGVYKIRLRTANRSQSAQEDLLRRLAERRDIVRVVLPSRD